MVEDLLKLGRRFRAFSEPKVCKTAQIDGLRISALIGTGGLEQFDGFTRLITAEFKKILDHKGANWGVFYSASYVGLGRAAALSGDIAKSRKAYQDFLALWKDADPDVPLLIEAKKEYAALH